MPSQLTNHYLFPLLARLVILLVAAALPLSLPSTAVHANTVHTERSLYRNIIVKKDSNVICLQFSVRKDQRNQSCIDSRRPRQMVFSYTRMMMATLLFTPEPRSILVVGLGGGTLATALAELYPEAHIDAVEIDPAVVRVAKKYFGFQPSDRLVVHEVDARVFTKRAQLRNRRYDIILLDAFNGDYIPEHLMTREYLSETANLMTPDGVLAANTFAISDLYDHESTTYSAVFDHLKNFRLPASSNRVMLATLVPPPTDKVLMDRARALRKRLQPYDIPIRHYAAHLDVGIDWNISARPLTDQYSPANLLQAR